MLASRLATAVTLVALSATSFASPVVAPPVDKRDLITTAALDAGTFTGTDVFGVSRFLGIPYALPPTGARRFSLPEPNAPYSGSRDATRYGYACPGQFIPSPDLPNGLDAVLNFATEAVFGQAAVQNEDCLTVNVVKPSSATSTSKLPVVVWIYGGGFTGGQTSLYDGGIIVSRSIAINAPVVYVSMNYRLSAFGFLGGKEVKDAGVGNLGLQDQRLALRWIQKYITSFGGDPSKVTIWGESAGSVSVALHMLTNEGNTEGLFRAGFMQSGSPLPFGDITKGQVYYDAIVQQTGCAGAANTLECLRGVPYQTLRDAINRQPAIVSYQSLNVAFGPRVDGVFLKDVPMKLVEQGRVANIPFITGDCDDEGTLFSFLTLNITTTAQLRTYLHDNYMPAAPYSEVDQVLAVYPQDITKGSPFDTGVLNALTPQFKRIAAIMGDLAFQAPRRFFLDQRSGKQNTWAYLSKRWKFTPFLGSLHASDLLNSYGQGELTDYLIRFATNLDPNGGTGKGIPWPKYDTNRRQLVTFTDNILVPSLLTRDTFRKEGIEVLTSLSLKYPL